MSNRTNPLTLEDLGEILSDMYNGAPEKDKVTMIHLFGIKCAGEIRRCGASAVSVVRYSTLPDSYHSEVSKGMRLARSSRCTPPSDNRQNALAHLQRQAGPCRNHRSGVGIFRHSWGTQICNIVGFWMVFGW